MESNYTTLNAAELVKAVSQKLGDTQSALKLERLFGSVVKRLESIDKQITSLSKTSEKRIEAQIKEIKPKTASPLSEPSAVTSQPQQSASKLQTLSTLQPVSVETISKSALEGLSSSLLEILPKAIKEGLVDIQKSLDELNKTSAKQAQGGGGGGILDTIVDALTLKSLLGGRRGGRPRGPKKPGLFGRMFGKKAPAPTPGAPDVPSTTPKKPGLFSRIFGKKPPGAEAVTPAKPAGMLSKMTSAVGIGGLGALAGGAAGYLGVKSLAQNALGVDPNFIKQDPRDLKQLAQEGNKEQKDLVKKQIGMQKEQVVAEGVSEVAGVGGGVLGAKFGSKLFSKAFEGVKSLGSKAVSATTSAATSIGKTAGEATTKASNLLKASKKAEALWRLFMRYLKKKAPKIAVQFGARLATAAGLAAIPIVGWVGTLVNLGLSLYTVYEIYQMWREFCELSEIEKQAYDEKSEEQLSDDKLPEAPGEVKSEPLPKPSEQQEAALAAKQKESEASKPVAEAPKAEAPKPVAEVRKAPPINVDKNLTENLSTDIQNKSRLIEQANLTEKLFQTQEFEKMREVREAVKKQLQVKSNNELDNVLEQYKNNTTLASLTLLSTKTIGGKEQPSLEQPASVTPADMEDKTIPKLKDGAVATKPIKAVIGDAGPEAVFPLDKLEKFLSNNNSKSDSILQKIADNTGLTNANLGGLIKGFNDLARSLKEAGSIKQAPVVINKGAEEQDNKTSISQLASIGNIEHSQFRASIWNDKFQAV